VSALRSSTGPAPAAGLPGGAAGPPGDALLRLAGEAPPRGLKAARAEASRAHRAGEVAAEVRALRAVAAAQLRLDPAAAPATAERAVRLAIEAGLPPLADQVRVTLANALRINGRTREAEELLAAVVKAGHRPARAEALATLGALGVVRAEPQPALSRLTTALRELDPAGIWTPLALANRGVLTAMQGDLVRAQRDLDRARTLLLESGCPGLASEPAFNQVWVRYLAGEYAGALQLLAEVEPVFARGGQSVVDVHLMRAMLLLAVGLAGPAADSARAALAEIDRVATEADRPEALLRLTEALSMQGLADLASGAAEQAAAAFLAQDRPRYADRVRLVALATRARGGAALLAGDLSEARSLATRLARGGQLDVAAQAGLVVAQLALAAGRRAESRRRLEQLAGTVRDWPNPDLRVGYWQVRAGLAAAAGDRRELLAAARSGLAVIDGTRGTLGATEARINVTAAATRFGDLVLPVVAGRGAAELFDWAEQVRGAALLMRPAHPARGRALASAQARLRVTATAVRDAADEGRSEQDVQALLRRQAEQEHDVRLLLLTAERNGGVPARVTAAGVRAELAGPAADGQVMVSYVEVAGSLLAVRLDGRRARLVDLGPVPRVVNELRHLGAVLNRFSRGFAGRHGRSRIAPTVQALDRLLLRPVDGSDRPLVVVPSPALLGLPWGLLPSAVARPLSVAPSASAWMTAGRRSPPRRGARARVVVAAGPQVEAAPREVDAVSRVWPSARRLDGAAATAGRLLAAAEGADILHVACHGVLRADNPLFSSLSVADGPLAVHDIERIRKAPSLVLLSACDSALTAPRPGGEWLGMASALLSVGTRSLVASVMPVPDGDTVVSLMTALHRRLAAGDTPAEALRSAREASDDDDPVALAVRAAFVCFGR
jgi:tetratricopeptide (TPR) repeat protein